MQKWLPGLLLIAPLLLASPAYAQLEIPQMPNIQGDGPVTRAKKALSDADQMNQDSRKGQSTSTPSSSTPRANSTPKGPVGSTGVNSMNGKKPPLSALDREALQAAKSGLEATYREKIAEGASPMASDDSGSTALHLAAYRGSLAIVDFLTNTKGVLLDARDTSGNTPLQLAAAAGREECVTSLLKAGASAKLKTSDGSTALHKAAMRGHASTVDALLRAGADANALDAQGRTPAALVEKTKHSGWEEMARVLHEAEKSAPSGK